MIYVMSDIHGNLRRFHSVLEQINLQPEDTLYILGDVIDRHPFGVEILKEIMATPNMKMLLGNHEYMMLNAIYPYKTGLPWEREQSGRTVSLWYSNSGEVTDTAMGKETREKQDEIFEYLKALPLNIDIEVGGKKYKLVHSAPVEFYTGAETWHYDDETAFAVWKRRFDLRKLPGDYTMIFGHTPTVHFQEGAILSIWRNPKGTAIGIDCGSGFDDDISEDFPLQGRLACLRLDDMAEFYSKERTEAVMELSKEDVVNDFQNA